MMIFFDIDDTLTDSESAHKQAIHNLFSNYCMKVDPDAVFSKWMEITSKYLALYFEDKISLEEQRAARIKEIFMMSGQQIQNEEALILYDNYHRDFLQSCIVFPETIPVLEMLKDIRLGIITNGPVADQTEKLRSNKLTDYFDPIIISEEVGFAKPKVEIFRAAAQAARHPLPECIFVGDSYEYDYLGGVAAGMKTIWLDRKRAMHLPESESIHSLLELPGYLQIK
ncbi:MAG: HAD family hydrolase [Bacteroidales bacterium]|jgi:putative hydrolase of the HAD superfamily